MKLTARISTSLIGKVMLARPLSRQKCYLIQWLRRQNLKCVVWLCLAIFCQIRTTLVLLLFLITKKTKIKTPKTNNELVICLKKVMFNSITYKHVSSDLVFSITAMMRNKSYSIGSNKRRKCWHVPLISFHQSIQESNLVTIYEVSLSKL